MKELFLTIFKLERVVLHKFRDNAVGVYFANRQLAHNHPYGYLNIPLPVENGDVAEQKFLTTPGLQEKNGWYSDEPYNEQEIGEAQWLLQLAQSLHEIKTRAADDDRTQQELADLYLDDCFYDYVVTAAYRWKYNAA